MINLPSDHSKDELIQRWDEYTSPARFAGSDDTLDLVFKSRRKNNKVILIRNANSMRNPYAAVFRGIIVNTEQGSEIRGFFTKTVFSYLMTAFIIFIAFVVRFAAEARNADLSTPNILLALCIIGGILLLYNYRPTKRRYIEFMIGITGNESDLFLSKKQLKRRNNGSN